MSNFAPSLIYTALNHRTLISLSIPNKLWQVGKWKCLYLLQNLYISHLNPFMNNELKNGQSVHTARILKPDHFRSSPPEVFVGKVFRKYAANFQENTHAKVWICCIFSELLFLRTPLEGCVCHFSISWMKGLGATNKLIATRVLYGNYLKLYSCLSKRRIIFGILQTVFIFVLDEDYTVWIFKNLIFFRKGVSLFLEDPETFIELC